MHRRLFGLELGGDEDGHRPLLGTGYSAEARAQWRAAAGGHRDRRRASVALTADGRLAGAGGEAWLATPQTPSRAGDMDMRLEHDDRDLSRELSALQRHCIEKYEELTQVAANTEVRGAPPVRAHALATGWPSAADRSRRIV